MSPSASPFSLDNGAGYASWREDKLSRHPGHLEDLIVEIKDPRRLTAAEHAAILERCRQANMAIYVCATGADPDKAIPRLLGAQFGLTRLDQNPGADEDAISAITIQSDALHRGFIPYTDRPIAWHTDGYYNPPGRRINAFILHCVRPAADGGINGMIDPELLYIRLRDRDPEHIRALMRADVMTIPANVVAGEEVRPASVGPVFASGANGHLLMRYTDRRRNIQWRDDTATTAAVDELRALLGAEETPRFHAKLEPGWGLICNNVLHSRSRFHDEARGDGTAERAAGRLLYRARYYDRIAGS